MKRKIPTALRIVAWIFILSGIQNIAEMVTSLAHNHINVNFEMINLFAGIGLLKLRSGWRVFSLVLIWLKLIVLPIVFILIVTAKIPLDFKLFEWGLDRSFLPLILFLLLIMYALLIWECYVLNRSDIKELFIKSAEQGNGEVRETPTEKLTE